ncbi:hypothetical protein PLICRDRAFT_32701 [Plicaturopsis crispa FD-325 SS-3]|uniref:F-box domain-containing protein n=1 Tax=Plicaturopsis crispa FD-325 SS-3 TaxID=944288 RepID=A0A0C9SKG4_PLICR|nr:hypothetical protein PLICRDRAFT_32701 [Plicaturopsis crispa FD-325 SS-3]
MHDCLYISEIVSRVCTELRLGSLAPKARGQKGFCFGDIARLARTCHALRDPALDALWHTLPSLAPLVRTLPADLWEEREAAEDEYGNTNREIVLLRLVEESDWARFAVYAPRVRALNYCDNSRWGGRAVFLDAGTTAALYTSAPKHLHLPNLLSIALDEEDPDHLLSNIAVLAHPDVASLTLKYPDDDLDSRIALLMALPAAFPALTCLAVDRSRGSVCEGDDPRITAALTKVIGACTRLETLRVTGLTPSALHAVATLPSLRALTVLSHVHMDFDTQHPPSLHTYPHSQQPFPALRALALLNPPPDAATAFLSLLPRIHALTDVEIYAPAHPPHRPEPWRALFEALAKHSSLVRVVVQGNFYADGSEAASGGDMLAIISPLLAFHRLEKLHVTLPLAVDLDDASRTDIATAHGWDTQHPPVETGYGPLAGR